MVFSRKIRNGFFLYLNLIIILSSIGIGCFFWYLTSSWEFSAAVIAAGISLAIGVTQTRLSNDRMTKELYKEFNERYDRLNNKLSQIKSGKDSPENRQTIIDYFNLCAEEYYWYSKGRIPCEIWKAWKDGIAFYAGIEIFNELAREEVRHDTSYYGFFNDVWFRLHKPVAYPCEETSMAAN